MQYHIIYARADAKGKAQKRNIENTRITWFSLVSLRPRRNPLRATFLLCKSVVQYYVIMNYNMSIYRRLNPKLLVQVKVGLSLLHWANMSNISLTFLLSLYLSIMYGPVSKNKIKTYSQIFTLKSIKIISSDIYIYRYTLTLIPFCLHT